MIDRCKGSVVKRCAASEARRLTSKATSKGAAAAHFHSLTGTGKGSCRLESLSTEQQKGATTIHFNRQLAAFASEPPSYLYLSPACRLHWGFDREDVRHDRRQKMNDGARIAKHQPSPYLLTGQRVRIYIWNRLIWDLI
jgi:hypothetical protein